MGEFKLTNKEYKEFLAFKEEYQENEQKRNLLLQEQNDILSAGIRSNNLKEYRNTYVINAQDSLDASYPMYTHFNIISEMTKIVSIKLSFWLLNYRAYSTAATEKAAVTSGASSATSSGASSAVSSASGGGETPTSSSVSTPSGGGDTSGTTTGTSLIRVLSTKDVTGVGTNNDSGKLVLTTDAAVLTDKDHIHTTPNHTHPEHNHTITIAAHTHNIPHTHNIEHTHNIPAHSHDITYGIHEEENSPTIVPSVSRDNGLTYSLPIGSYSKSQENLDITSFIDTLGSKMIKFESSTRARLSVQVTIKLDIKAR